MIDREKYVIDLDYERCEFTLGSTVEFETCMDDSEIRVDVEAGKKQSIHIFGQVKSLEGQALSGALVRLQKIECLERTELVTIADTLTDKQGLYQFETVCDDERMSYLVIVEKPVMEGGRMGYTMVGCAAFSC